MSYRSQISNLLRSSDTFATTMLTLVVDQYSTEAFDWSPITLTSELNSDFQVQTHPGNIDRLMAGIAVMTSDRLWRVLPDFIDFCNIFSGSTHNPTLFDLADVEEVAWGISEAYIIAPPDDDNPFEAEIIGYMEEIIRAEGFITLPPVLRQYVSPNTTDRGEVFADDPEMYAAFYESQSTKVSDVDAFLKKRLAKLLAQLQGLPLTSVGANAQEAVHKLIKATK